MTISDTMNAGVDAIVRPLSLAEAKPAGRGFVPFTTARLLGMESGASVHGEGMGDDEYARGFAEGHAAAKAECERENARLLALVRSAEAFQAEPCEELTMLISETVEQIVTRIFGEQQGNPEWMAKVIDDAVAVVSECDQARSICLNPEDAEMIAGMEMPLAVVADARMSRGSVRIECAGGAIENGMSTYMQQLRTALGHKEGAQ